MPLTPQDTQALGNMGGSMNQAAYHFAQMRYQQAMRQQQLAIQLGHLALQRQLGEAQIGHLNAQAATEGNRQDEIGAQANMERAHTANYNVQTKQTQAEMDAAQGLGNSVQQFRQAPFMEGPTQGGGTLDVQQSRNSFADIGKFAAIAAALSKKGGDFAMPQSVNANQILADPMSGGVVAQGPMLLNQGQQYQLPGGGPVYVNPKPPGSGNDLSALLKFITSANRADPTSPDPSGDYPLRNTPMYTNAVDIATAAMKGIQSGPRGGQEGPTNAVPAPSTGGKVVYATNPKTKERVQSTDGGKTWQPVQ